MISLLLSILGAIGDFGLYILSALVEFVNLIFAGISALVIVLFSLLPSMPEGEALGSPEWLRWMNWFLPVSAILSLLSTGILLYVAWLVVRYVLQIVRAA